MQDSGRDEACEVTSRSGWLRPDARRGFRKAWARIEVWVCHPPRCANRNKTQMQPERILNRADHYRLQLKVSDLINLISDLALACRRARNVILFTSGL